MRCFIAIEFDETTKAFLAKLQDSIRAAGINGNYTLQDNFHLTMQFLGEIDHKIVNKLESVLAKVALDSKPLVLELGILGKFNKGSRPIIWCGIESYDQLNSLQMRLMAKLGAELPQFSDQSGFSPHITLVREAVMSDAKQTKSLYKWNDEGRHKSGINFEELFAAIGKTSISYLTGGLSLMESIREDGRLKYVQKCFYKFG